MPMSVTSKRQVTIPKPVRDRLALTASDKVTFRLNDRGQVVIERADGEPPKSRLAHLVGSAGPGPSCARYAR